MTTRLTLDEFIALRRCASGHFSTRADSLKVILDLSKKGLVDLDNSRLTRAGLAMLSLTEERLAVFFEKLMADDKEFEKWLME